MRKCEYAEQLSKGAWIGAVVGWLVVALSPVVGLGIVYICLGIGIAAERSVQAN